MNYFRWPDAPKSGRSKLTYIILNLLFVVIGFCIGYLTLPERSQDWYAQNIQTFLAVGFFASAFIAFLYWFMLLSLIRWLFRNK